MSIWWKNLFGGDVTKEEMNYLLNDYVPKGETKLYRCPYCGYAVRSVENNNLKCKNCQKTVIIRDGQVIGWR